MIPSSVIPDPDRGSSVVCLSSICHSPTFVIGNPVSLLFLPCEGERRWILAFARMTDKGEPVFGFFHAGAKPRMFPPFALTNPEGRCLLFA